MNTNLQKKKSLVQKVFLTFSLLSIVRLGSFIPLPYIDVDSFSKLAENEASSMNTYSQILNRFSSNSFGIFSLGILPYINASIVLQLLTTAFPALSKLQKEEGEYGRRKMTDYLRYLTLFWAIVESILLTHSLRTLVFDWGRWTGLEICLSLISGSMIVLWFSELLTKNGLGNGSSLLICFNIISNLPDQLKTSSLFSEDPTNTFGKSFFLVLVFLATTTGCIFVTEAIIKLPIVSARELQRQNLVGGRELTEPVLPLKLNQAGVMPLVFTSYVMVVVTSLLNFCQKHLPSLFFLSNLGVNESFLFWCGKALFWGVYAGLIFFFTYFYSSIVLDPKEVSERLQKTSVVIAKIEPGKPTETYLRQTLGRIAKINAIFLILNIIGLQLMESFLGFGFGGLKGLGFTSQLILVNILIDIFKKIQSELNSDQIVF